MENARDTPLSAAAGRIAWTILCPMAMMPLTLSILLKSRGWLTGVDVAYFVFLGLALAGRWLEFRGGNARTAYGEPATPAHLRRYLLVAPAIALAVWVLANIIGNHLLPGRW